MNRLSESLLLERWIYVLVKVDGDFLLAQTRGGRKTIAACGEYEAGFMGFLDRFMAILAEENWPSGSYYPGGFHRNYKKAGINPDDALENRDNLKPFFVEETLVDRKGRWFIGKKPLRGKILKFFLDHLEFDPDPGRYRIRYPLEKGFEVNYLHHQSPPFRVVRVISGPQGLELILNTGRDQMLNPDSLRMDHEENLYCAVGPHQLPGWFKPEARWEVLKLAEEQGGCWFLKTSQGRVPLHLHAAWPYLGPPQHPMGLPLSEER